MIQTTLVVYNADAYDLSTTQALLAWHRVRLANWLATSGEEWSDIVSPHNSGNHIYGLLRTQNVLNISVARLQDSFLMLHAEKLHAISKNYEYKATISVQE